jgi:LytS/YehU family sensor histidine kinase
MLTLTIADNLRLTRLGRTATLVTGLLVGTFIAWALHLVIEFGNPLALTYRDVLESIPNGLLPVVSTGLIALVYFKRRRDLEIAAALHEAGLARVGLQKRTLESNLQAMQARVEPRFLLNTLRSVGLLYKTDVVVADRMLDHLIEYLRAALPQMRSTASTLRAELELVRAYLGIQQIRANGLLEFVIDVPEDVLDVAFTPMLLLPFVEDTLRRGSDAAGERRQLRLSIGADDRHLTVALTDSCTAKHAEETAEVLHSRLAALYGNDATLVMHPQQRGIETVMRIPFVRALQRNEGSIAVV